GLVTLVVWVAAIFIPAGQYQVDADGSPIPGTYEQVEAPLDAAERVQQLILSPVNGLYGVQDALTGFVDTENAGRLFGSVGVVLFIMSLGAFISVSFATRSLEVGVMRLAGSLADKGWLLIVAIMTLFSLLGSTMGFSVETFGFYPLLIPLMLALGYDRMVTAATIILGALTGAMASTVNPFSIGVASGEAGVSIGDGIVLRVFLWIVLTSMSIAFVLRYAAKVRRDPGSSVVGFDVPADEEEPAAEPVGSTLSGAQKWVLGITGFTFALMIFSVIPWSSIFGAGTGPAEDEVLHQTTVEPYWWELGWWFPQLSMLFVLAAIAVGLVARMGEGRIVSLIGRGAADMIGPAIVIMLARGVSVIMTNTQTLDTILNAMETVVAGASAAVFAVLVTLVNIPLAFLIPSSSGHATLAMPLLAPLGDFAGVSRPLVITAYQMGHGFMLMFAPTNVVVVGGLAIAKVGYDKYLKLVWPLLAAMFVVVVIIIGAAAALE
ncbi:MAG TPA: YfcC family protein, partial [Actinotalea sp.]|nr:YfcC family protein [Actinotalea sp.]